MHQNLLDYTYLGPVVQRADNAIQQRNRYPAKKCWQNLIEKKDWATLAYPCGVKEPTKIWHAPIMWLKNSFGSSTK